MMQRGSETVRLPVPAGGAIQVYLSCTKVRNDWAVVFVHGFGSTRSGFKAQALEAACARRDWTFASFDFRGHGQSTGTLLELRGTGLLEDLAAVRDYLVSRGIPRFCPVGSSMGGWAAAWFTAHHPCSVPACVLIAPALDFLHSRWALLSDDLRQQWQRKGRLRVTNQWVDVELGYGLVEELDRFPVARLAAEFNRPALLLHGLKDEVVPYTTSLDFFEKAACPAIELRLYKDGDHRLLSYRDELAEAACEFFARQAGPVSDHPVR